MVCGTAPSRHLRPRLLPLPAPQSPQPVLRRPTLTSLLPPAGWRSCGVSNCVVGTPLAAPPQCDAVRGSSEGRRRVMNASVRGKWMLLRGNRLIHTHTRMFTRKTLVIRWYNITSGYPTTSRSRLRSREVAMLGSAANLGGLYGCKDGSWESVLNTAGHRRKRVRSSDKA